MSKAVGIPNDQTATERRPHILAKEDDPAVRDLLAELLETEGYRVSLSTAEDAAEVAGLAPDLILLDYRGAGASWGFLDRLKADPVAAPIPILVLTTAHWEASDQAARFRDIDVAVALKPFDIDRLLREVDRAPEGSHLRAG